MGNFFRLDGPFVRFGTKVANLLVLNFITILFSVPIITIGPVITAAHYTAYKISRDEETSVVKHFWHAFKINFKPALGLGLLSLLCLVILAANIFFLLYGAVQIPIRFLKYLYIVILALLAVIGFFILSWAFVLESRYTDPVKRILKNCVYVILTNFKKTLGISLLGLVPIALVLLSMQTCLIVLVCGFSVTAFLQARIYGKVFAALEKTDESEENGEEELPAPEEGE